MFSYLPHTDADIKAMLKAAGVQNIDDLFSDIPDRIRFNKKLDLPEGLSEYEVYKKLSSLSDKNHQAVSFLGGGSYDHIIPSPVKHLISRSEFYTAYTPYQAEISQGVLHAIFEFQSMICELTSLDVSNASLYDGHTAAIEACSIALNSKRKANTILYSKTIHPHTLEVMKTFYSDLGISLSGIDDEDGTVSLDCLKRSLNPDVAAVLVQSPNFTGLIEDYTGFADLIHENGSFFIISSNPLSLGLLKSQGEWGADIGIGDTQPFGLPSYLGGPSVGYIAAVKKLLRKIPGRIAGETVDKDGKRAFVLTLQAREQHIKRERAASNICSNQANAALAATVYLSAVGRNGLIECARQNVQKAHYLFNRLITELPVEKVSSKPFFNEFPIRLKKNAAGVLKKMENAGFYAGIQLDKYDNKKYKNIISVAVTEKRTKEEIDSYVEKMRKVLYEADF